MMRLTNITIRLEFLGSGDFTDRSSAYNCIVAYNGEASTLHMVIMDLKDDEFMVLIRSIVAENNPSLVCDKVQDMNYRCVRRCETNNPAIICAALEFTSLTTTNRQCSPRTTELLVSKPIVLRTFGPCLSCPNRLRDGWK